MQKKIYLTRALSITFHIGFIIFLIFLPKIFPAHVPTRDEIELASKELGVVYLPSDADTLSKVPKPAAPRINSKTLNTVAPPRPESHMTAPPPPAPSKSRTCRLAVGSDSTEVPINPTRQPHCHRMRLLVPSAVLPVQPSTQPKPGLNLGLPNSSPGQNSERSDSGRN